MRIDVYLHAVGDDGVTRRLDCILGKLEELMALVDDFRAGFVKLDQETTAIAALITSLASRIKNSMTDAEAAELKGDLGVLGDRLKTLSVDPTVPVPPETPALAALKKKAP